MSNEEKRTLFGGKRRISAARMSPNGEFIAIASLDEDLQIWTATGEFIGSIKDEKWYSCLDWSPDGTFLVGGTINGTVKIWPTERLVVPDEKHDNPPIFKTTQRIVSVAISPTMTDVINYIAIGTALNKILILDKQGNIISELYTRRYAAQIHWVRSSRQVAWNERTIQYLDFGDGVYQRNIFENRQPDRPIISALDNISWASNSPSGTFCTYDSRSGRGYLQRYERYNKIVGRETKNGYIWSMQYIPGKNTLLLGTENGIRFEDIMTPAEILQEIITVGFFDNGSWGDFIRYDPIYDPRLFLFIWDFIEYTPPKLEPVAQVPVAQVPVAQVPVAQVPVAQRMESKDDELAPLLARETYSNDINYSSGQNFNAGVFDWIYNLFA